MILGKAIVRNGAIETNRDSFILSNISVVSVRRPYLVCSVLLGAELLGFNYTFNDLLYEHEEQVIIGCTGAITLLGLLVGRLSLVSRDLKGTELSTALWGYPGSLQKIRKKIVEERQRLLKEEVNERSH